MDDEFASLRNEEEKMDVDFALLRNEDKMDVDHRDEGNVFK